MYGVVLVMALAGSAEAPDCHHSCGCTGYSYSSCCSYTSCYGGYTGCYGTSYGCTGTSYGCTGTVSYGCTGTYGCYGSVSYGCYGGCYGRHHGCHGYSTGCYGTSYGCYGTTYGGCTGITSYGCYGGVVVPPGNTVTPPKEMPKEKLDAPKQKEVSTPATIVVTLPADAKLTIDGYVSKQTTSERRLVTVPIQPGEQFTYEFVAEMNGTRQTQTVTVRGGQTAPVNFNFSTAPAAASR